MPRVRVADAMTDKDAAEAEAYVLREYGISLNLLQSRIDDVLRGMTVPHAEAMRRVMWSLHRLLEDTP
jgi:hypothetical protein